MIPALETALTVWRTFGAEAGARRARFELRRAAGRFRADPSPVRESVLAAPPPRGWPFAATRGRVAAETDIVVAIERAEAVLDGRHQAYRHAWVPRPRTPEEWTTHPASGFAHDPRRPWFRIQLLDPAVGDIKDLWEPARFAWTYDLLRGWLLTGDDRYAEAAWGGVDTFLAGCPPFRGPQWACGQETAIRAIAWLWLEHTLLGAAPTTPARLGALRRALAWSAERIDDAFDYALSQRNNHAISEAVGLVVIGARLRGADPRAYRWLRTGRSTLERLVLQQIAPDGWYIQHSFNYARLALDQLVLGERALRAAGHALSEPAVERIRALVRLLATVADPASGRVPNHGANDGAYALPLTTAAYRDFRPSLSAAAATFDEPLRDDLAEDGEVLAWLGAAPPPRRPAPVPPWVETGRSGWVAAATAGARVFARAGEYRSRPAHLDPLHVDIWIDGRAVAVDAGTYRYVAPDPFREGLAGVEVHNTLTVAGAPPGRRGPRFLWLRWPSARIRNAGVTVEGDVVIRLENRSWRGHGIVHRRECRLGDGGALVLDSVTVRSSEPVRISLQWLLADAAEDVVIAADTELDEHRESASETSVLGWRSEQYGSVRPAHSLTVHATARGRLRIASGFGDWRDPALLRQTLEETGAPERTGEAPQWAGSRST